LELLHLFKDSKRRLADRCINSQSSHLGDHVPLGFYVALALGGGAFRFDESDHHNPHVAMLSTGSQQALT
jgi:hypothetical protein